MFVPIGTIKNFNSLLIKNYLYSDLTEFLVLHKNNSTFNNNSNKNV